MSITFDDGTMATADLVIGADGIHSSVRSHYVVCTSLMTINQENKSNSYDRMTALSMARW